MSVKLQVIMEALEQLAPRRLAEEWDRVGLQLGQGAQEIRRVLVALDVNEAVAAEAKKVEADLIVAHHPFIFKPLEQIHTDRFPGNLLQQFLRDNVALVAAHTNLDYATGGLNDWLAEALELQNVDVLQAGPEEKLLKLVVFVPVEAVEEVQDALARAGAGHIGRYSHCSFQSAGEGTFLPLEGTNPYKGKQGKLERTPEIRLETILPQRISGRALRAMLRSHPYEEVAYDLYPLVNERREGGLGRIGLLRGEMTLAELAKQVARKLDLPGVRLVGDSQKIIRKAAVCGGAGSSLIGKAAFRGADVLITGDIKYHEAQQAQNSGLALLDAGHFGTEKLMVGKVAQYLLEQSVAGKWNVEVIAAQSERDVFSWEPCGE